jgi:hypothetical protein
MNRLNHIQQTLERNILDNISYPGVEFVLLDYHSTDGLSEWIAEEMSVYLRQGILSYYRYEDAEYFDRSHSRNMAFKLANGDIICNVDADNFLGKNFAFYLHDRFEENKNIFVIPDTHKQFYYIRDVMGRFCVQRNDFLAIAGYDEKMSGYGYEDNDLYERLVKSGRNEVVIQDWSFLRTIRHTNEARIMNEFFTNCFLNIYVYYESFTRSQIIILFKDHSFHKGTIVPAQKDLPNEVVLENLAWEKGTWEQLNGIVILNHLNDEKQEILTDHVDSLCIENKVFYKIVNPAFLQRVIWELPLITNYGRYLLNKKDASINKAGFGMGKVFKNFVTEPIIVD